MKKNLLINQMSCMERSYEKKKHKKNLQETQNHKEASTLLRALVFKLTDLDISQVLYCINRSLRKGLSYFETSHRRCNSIK